MAFRNVANFSSAVCRANVGVLVGLFHPSSWCREYRDVSLMSEVGIRLPEGWKEGRKEGRKEGSNAAFVDRM